MTRASYGQARVGIVRILAETLAGLLFVSLSAVALFFTAMTSWETGQAQSLINSGPEDWWRAASRFGLTVGVIVTVSTLASAARWQGRFVLPDWALVMSTALAALIAFLFIWPGLALWDTNDIGPRSNYGAGLQSILPIAALGLLVALFHVTRKLRRGTWITPRRAVLCSGSLVVGVAATATVLVLIGIRLA
ncbi:MAG: hypothetical protein JWP75_2950 [Frondihabitans sp.]|nr:hypothetical protein [Frondihabitans sp.]